MYYLFTDETNIDPSDSIKFFAYGGLIIPFSNQVKIHFGIERIREKFGYKKQDLLKFDTNSRPKYVSAEDATKAKREVIELCITTNCKFISYIVHHEIAK